jgi:CheY-like chemotaxis protein
MGGTIEVDSRLGEGSTFRVHLPLIPAPGAETASPALCLAGKRALIVARSPFEALFLGRRLAEAGAEVGTAETLDQALARLDEACRHILIVDGAFGENAVRAIAAAALRSGAERRIVLLSPFERRDFGSPRAAGLDGYLVKPVRTESFHKQLAGGSALGPSAVLPAPAQPSPTPSGRRILLAEDNEINALLALKSLEKLGAVADWAKDGREAVALAEASFGADGRPYDVVLMDIRMPELDGLEATRRIRLREEALGRSAPCRIVALTANTLDEDIAAALNAGVDGFLAKPLKLEALMGLLTPAESPVAEAS